MRLDVAGGCTLDKTVLTCDKEWSSYIVRLNMNAWSVVARICCSLALSIRTFCFGNSALPVVGSSCPAVTIFGRIAAVVLAMQLGVAAQDFQVRNWYVENGLPDSTVTSPAQTPDGYLWVGTRKGLARFDGESFKRIETGGGNPLHDSSVWGC